MPSTSNPFPSINDLLDSPQLKKLVDRVSRSTVATGVGQFLEKFSGNVQAAMVAAKIPTPQELAQRIADWIASQQRTALRPTINATGVLLDPRLGGPPLSAEGVEAIRIMAAGYACVPHDAGDATCSFSTVAEEWLVRLTGAEAAFIANRPSAALIATLATLAAGREVLISRGEVLAVESEANLPDVVAAAGVTLKEVGTTPVTRLTDFEAAINDRTAVILRVRTGLNAAVGTVEQPTLCDLAKLAKQKNLILVDVQPGAIVDVSRYQIAGETTVQESLQAGADVVIFPGSDLLGGPLCGIVVGQQTRIKKLKKSIQGTSTVANKLTLAGLSALLPSYVNVETAEQAIPLLSLLATSLDNLKNRAERLAPQLAECSLVDSAAAVEDTIYLRGSQVDGQALRTWCVEITAKNNNVAGLVARLKCSSPAVLGRVVADRLRIDLRSVPARDDMAIAEVFAALGTHDETNSYGEEPTETPQS